MSSGSDATVEAAYRFLRANTTGDLQFDEHLRPIKYVIAPDGRLAAPVMVAMIRAQETVLFIPEDAETETGVLQLLLTVTQFDERGSDGAIADRWRIHHGEPEDVRWAFLGIDAGKFRGSVIDGEVLMRPNTLAADEPKVCKAMNQRPDVLRALALHHAHLEIEKPLMVGLDPLGIDIRGRFDVVRVEAARPMTGADDALAHLAELYEQVKDRPHPAEAEDERARCGEAGDD
jgi:hypothetical protein